MRFPHALATFDPWPFLPPCRKLVFQVFFVFRLAKSSYFAAEFENTSPAAPGTRPLDVFPREDKMTPEGAISRHPADAQVGRRHDVGSLFR